MQGVAAHKTEDSISAVKKVASQPTEGGLCDEARRKSKAGELVRATGDSQSMAPYSKEALLGGVPMSPSEFHSQLCRNFGTFSCRLSEFQ